MGTKVDDRTSAIVALRARLVERLAYAELQRANERVNAPMAHDASNTREWARGYWTGAADGYNIAITALDVCALADGFRIEGAE